MRAAIQPESTGLELARGSRGVTAPVPRVYLPVSLTTPAPSGSTGTTRLCRGCSRPHRRPPAQTSSSFTPPLRRQSNGGLAPPSETPAPRGALRLPPASPRRYDSKEKRSFTSIRTPRLVAHHPPARTAHPGASRGTRCSSPRNHASILRARSLSASSWTASPSQAILNATATASTVSSVTQNRPCCGGRPLSRQHAGQHRRTHANREDRG